MYIYILPLALEPSPLFRAGMSPSKGSIIYLAPAWSNGMSLTPMSCHHSSQCQVLMGGPLVFDATGIQPLGIKRRERTLEMNQLTTHIFISSPLR